MGAFNFFGNFLGGYVKARQQKTEMQLQRQGQLMNEAQQWAGIADRASGPAGDAIRETATKNMQNLITQHEKETGEKHGLGAVLKLFKHDKPDMPSLLNKMAPALSKPAPIDVAPMNTLDRTQGGSPSGVLRSSVNDINAEIPGETKNYATSVPDATAPGIFAGAANTDQQNPQVPAASVATSAPAPVATATSVSGPNWYTPTNQSAAARSQAIAQSLAPGKSVFFPQYSGGTRYSPTAEESAQTQLGITGRAQQQTANIQTEAEKQRIVAESEARQKEYQSKLDAETKDKIESTQRQVTAINEAQEKGMLTPGQAAMETMRLKAGFNAQEFLKVSSTPKDGSRTFKGNDVMATNIFGEEIPVTEQFEKDNPEAADFHRSGKNTWPQAVELGSEVKRNILKATLKDMGSKANMQDAEATYYAQRGALEKAGITKENNQLRIAEMNRFQGLIKDGLEAWKAKSAQLLNNTYGTAGLDEIVTGKRPDGSKSDQPGIKDPSDPKGGNFKSADDYKDRFIESTTGYTLKDLSYLAVHGLPKEEVGDLTQKGPSGPSGPTLPGKGATGISAITPKAKPGANEMLNKKTKSLIDLVNTK